MNPLGDMSVVAAGATADTTFLKEAAPHVVLLDLGPRNGESPRLARQVKLDCPRSRVIVMDLLPARDDLVDFIAAGVSGFVMKDASFDDLIATVRSVAGGAQVLPPEMTRTLFSQIAKEAAVHHKPDVLASGRMTPRERQVIGLIGEGLSNKAIGGRLHIATHTVKSHVRNVMEKLALHTRLQIAAYVHREGPAPDGVTPTSSHRAMGAGIELR